LTQHRPFRVLRARGNAGPAAKGAEQPGAPPRSELSFSEAAASAGVVPLGGTSRRVAKGSPKRPLATTAPPRFSVEQADGWLAGYREELGPSALRRLHGTPSATLDLHGATVARARKELAAFLATERARGRSLICIIVGKGRHSPGGHAVLRGELADWLVGAPARTHVLAFGTAPPALGGSGSVLVLLAPPD